MIIVHDSTLCHLLGKFLCPLTNHYARMAISEETRIRLQFTTKDAAHAFVEDISDIREIAQRCNVGRGELRRLSSILRRLLIDNNGDLSSIAPPRIGKITILAPDNSPAYHDAKKNVFTFFGSGYGAGPKEFGLPIRGSCVRKGTLPPIVGLDNLATIDLSHDGFLSQNVICFHEEWISRRAVIKYMANIAGGVHSGQPQEHIEELLKIIRHCTRYIIKNDNVHVEFNMNTTINKIVNENYADPRIDPVLVEIMSACHYLILSPSIQKLEDFIRYEFGLPPVATHFSIL